MCLVGATVLWYFSKFLDLLSFSQNHISPPYQDLHLERTLNLAWPFSFSKSRQDFLLLIYQNLYLGFCLCLGDCSMLLARYIKIWNHPNYVLISSMSFEFFVVLWSRFLLSKLLLLLNPRNKLKLVSATFHLLNSMTKKYSSSVQYW